jgi:hypothetical protein
MVETLEVTGEARARFRGVLRPSSPGALRPLVEVMRFLTVGLLPERVRAGYGLTWDPGAIGLSPHWPARSAAGSCRCCPMRCVDGRTHVSRTAGQPVNRLAHGPPRPHVRGGRGGGPGGSVPAYGPSRRPQARRSGLSVDLFASRRARSRASPSIWFAQRSPQPRHPTQAARRIPDRHRAHPRAPLRAAGPLLRRSARPARPRDEAPTPRHEDGPCRLRSRAERRTSPRAHAQTAPAAVPPEAPGVRERTGHPAHPTRRPSSVPVRPLPRTRRPSSGPAPRSTTQRTSPRWR